MEGSEAHQKGSRPALGGVLTRRPRITLGSDEWDYITTYSEKAEISPGEVIVAMVRTAMRIVRESLAPDSWNQ